MNKEFKTRLLFYLVRSWDKKGFTLLELILVMVFLATFAAIALPNFIKQAAKAREVEIKHTIGTVGRAQQAYHWEKGVFAAAATDDITLELLNTRFNNKYIDSYNIISYSSPAYATITPINVDYDKDQTRAYSGATYFEAGVYNVVICQSFYASASSLAPSITGDCGPDADPLK